MENNGENPKSSEAAKRAVGDMEAAAQRVQEVGNHNIETSSVSGDELNDEEWNQIRNVLIQIKRAPFNEREALLETEKEKLPDSRLKDELDRRYRATLGESDDERPIDVEGDEKSRQEEIAPEEGQIRRTSAGRDVLFALDGKRYQEEVEWKGKGKDKVKTQSWKLLEHNRTIHTRQGWWHWDQEKDDFVLDGENPISPTREPIQVSAESVSDAKPEGIETSIFTKKFIQQPDGIYSHVMQGGKKWNPVNVGQNYGATNDEGIKGNIVFKEGMKEFDFFPTRKSSVEPPPEPLLRSEPAVATAKDFISGRIEGARVVTAVANQHYRSNGSGGVDIQDPGHDITIETKDGKRETISIPPGVIDLQTLNNAIQQKKGPDASRVLEAVYREKERLVKSVTSQEENLPDTKQNPAPEPTPKQGGGGGEKEPPPKTTGPEPEPRPSPQPIYPTPEPNPGIPLDNAILKGLQDDIARLKERFGGKTATAGEKPADITALEHQITKTRLENELGTLKAQGQKTGQETVEGFMKGVRELTDKSHYERAYEALKLERGRENMSEFEKLGYIRSQAKISEAWNKTFPAWSRIALTAGILGAGLFATNVIAPALAGVCGLATIVWKGIFGATAGAAIGALTERHRMKTKRSNPTFWGGIATILATLVTMGTTIDIQKLR